MSISGTRTGSVVPVLPSMEGFGVETPAGRGGRVVRVTSLAGSGEGTLRAAIDAKGPRVIVFEVGGVIDLKGEMLMIRHPFVTIAGQTAPAPGITLIRGGIWISTHDILIQHLRVRPGDMGQPKGSGWEPDGISTIDACKEGGSGPYGVVIDHCSITWAVDENLSASGLRHHGREWTAHRVTFSNCLIAEALNDSTHPKGAHSKGTLLHDHVRDVAIIRNLYACNRDRNPVLKPDASAAVVNNYIYNPGQCAIRTLWTPNEYEGRMDTLLPSELAAVGNVLRPGPDTPADMPMFEIGEGQARVYLSGNVVRTEAGDVEPTISSPGPTVLPAPPLWPERLTVLPAVEVADHVLANAGAWPARRDAIDQRIIEGVASGRARIIDSQDEVGGYPDVPLTRHTLDLPAEPNALADGSDYTNLERWLHERAAIVEGRA